MDDPEALCVSDPWVRAGDGEFLTKQGDVEAYELEGWPLRLRILRIGVAWFVSCPNLCVDCVPLRSTTLGSAKAEASMHVRHALRGLEMELYRLSYGKPTHTG